MEFYRFYIKRMEQPAAQAPALRERLLNFRSLLTFLVYPDKRIKLSILFFIIMRKQIRVKVSDHHSLRRQMRPAGRARSEPS
jgi:hypothetical protein